MYKQMSLIFRELGLTKEEKRFYAPKVQSARVWGSISSEKMKLDVRTIYLYKKEEVENIVNSVPFGIILKRGAKLKSKPKTEPKQKTEAKPKKELKVWYKKVNLNIPLKVLAKLETIDKVEGILNKLIPLRYNKTDFKDTDRSLPAQSNTIRISKTNLEKINEVCTYQKQVKNLLRNILINYANKN